MPPSSLPSLNQVMMSAPAPVSPKGSLRSPKGSLSQKRQTYSAWCQSTAGSTTTNVTQSDFSETIIILVGPQEAKFTAHEAIICKDSRFFRALCSGQWAESTSRTARLPEDDPEVFQSYLQYTYARVFDAHTNWWEYDLVKLINIYVLADKLQNASLCNYTIDKLLSYYVAEHTWPSAYTASQVWNATPEKSPLRKLIVDYYCTMVPRHYFEQNYKKLPNDLILTMAFMSRPSTTASRNQYTAIKPGPNSKCQYHVHEAGEETCK